MKILVDLEKCQGYGNCVIAAPDVFDLNDEGKVIVINNNPSDIAILRQAVRECPADALGLE